MSRDRVMRGVCSLADGLLRNLGISVEREDQIPDAYRMPEVVDE